MSLTHEQFVRIERAVRLATNRILEKGADDVFRPPIFARSVESLVLDQKPDEFRQEAQERAIRFLKAADLHREKIGPPRRGLVAKDQNSFRQVAWFDPFEAVKYLAVAYLLFDRIEAARIPKAEGIINSHRLSDNDNQIFDARFGYDSFRDASSELSKSRTGQWKVVTDISNFFDRVGIHHLENTLKEIGCDQQHTTLLRDILEFWADGRRSHGIPVGSDASRIVSEAALLHVDRRLRDKGIVFVRYVDDFRIFAKTRAEALKTIEVLTSLLWEEGLALNTRKTGVFRIVDADELTTQIANQFAGGEHEKIDINEKIEIKRAIRVSGRSTIARFYREPGKEALLKIKAIPKDVVTRDFENASDADVEQQIKLVVKYFVYADQDVSLLKLLLDRKITAIFYIADALVKEAEHFTPERCDEIKDAVYGAEDWLQCAYPLQMPVLRLSAHPAFRDPRFVRSLVESHHSSEGMLLYREAISIGYPCLNRTQIRTLAVQRFWEVPDFVQRAIYFATMQSAEIDGDEKRPLLKNMKQGLDDWFIRNL
jgi:hypothetical protein